MQIKTKIVSCHTADSKPVKQEVNGTVILPPLVFPTYDNSKKARVFHIANVTITTDFAIIVTYRCIMFMKLDPGKGALLFYAPGFNAIVRIAEKIFS